MSKSIRSMDVDRCVELLALRGWSAVETASRRSDGTWYFRVDATRGVEILLASAPSRREAWSAALRLAGGTRRQKKHRHSRPVELAVIF
jgi:hypothetical protein